MSQVLETLYASAPVDDVIIHTLELKSAGFNGHIRIAQGFDDAVVTLENGGRARFEASGFGVSLPHRAVKGKQDLQFQLDNVTGRAIKEIDSALESGDTISVTYRAYAGSDLSAPGQPPLVLTATSVQTDINTVVVVASFNDLVNKAWPRRRYTPSFAPGLKYYG
jgi:hypothetical protein